jgi:hypothetical protein
MHTIRNPVVYVVAAFELGAGPGAWSVVSSHRGADGESWLRARGAAEKAFARASEDRTHVVLVLVRLCDTPRVHRSSWGDCGLNLANVPDSALPESRALRQLLSDEMVRYVVDATTPKKAEAKQD